MVCVVDFKRALLLFGSLNLELLTRRWPSVTNVLVSRHITEIGPTARGFTGLFLAWV